MFTQFLQRFFSSSQITNNIEELQLKQIREEEQSISASISKQAPTRKDITATSMPDTTYADDIKKLEREFGKLHEGQVINLTLHEALELMPRTRKRSDAYRGVMSELKKLYGVSLNVGGNNNANKQ